MVIIDVNSNLILPRSTTHIPLIVLASNQILVSVVQTNGFCEPPLGLMVGSEVK